MERRPATPEATTDNAEEQRLAKLAEAARAQQAATCAREEQLIASLKGTSDLGRAREELRQLQYDLVCERLRPSVFAALEDVNRTEQDRWSKLADAARARREADCRREEELIASSQTSANRVKAREDLKKLEYDLVCERLRPSLRTALEKIR